MSLKKMFYPILLVAPTLFLQIIFSDLQRIFLTVRILYL